MFLAMLLCLTLPRVALQAATEVLLNGTEFNSTEAFENAYNYNYPWGTDHNGSARMNAADDTVSGGVMTLTSTPTSGEGTSSEPPHLTIHYNSGTFYAKRLIVVNSDYPTWTISGDFKDSTQVGTWPAFWITGADSWPPESDIMELKGSDSVWQNTYDGTWQTKLTTVSTANTTWHNYKAVVTMANATDVTIQYYIDGVLTATNTAHNFVGAPMWMIVDYQMEGDSGNPGPSSVTYMLAKNIQISRENTITSLPGVPSGITAVSGEDMQVRLDWPDVSGASFYNVKRATATGGPYTTVASNVPYPSYTDKGVTDGTTYYYVISAVNPVGESANSSEISATPLAQTKLSGTIIGSSGSWNNAGNTINNVFDGDLFTFYDAVDASGDWAGLDLGSSKVISQIAYSPRVNYAYRMTEGVFQGSNDASFTSPVTLFTVNTAPPDAEFTTQSISGSGAYRYVRYLGPDNGFCNVAEVKFYTPAVTPSAPAGLTAAAVSGSEIDLSWEASPGATSYNIKYATTSGGPYTTLASGVNTIRLDYSDTGLADSTTYYYVVSAVNGSGESTVSTEASATTLAPPQLPAAPTGLSASPVHHKQVTLNWTQSTSSNIVSNNVYRSTINGGPYTLAATISATTSYNDRGMTAGTTYYYVVTAVDSNGQESLNSSQTSVTAN